MTTTNRFENWRIRLLGALALMLITLGLVQAQGGGYPGYPLLVLDFNCGTNPCDSCPSRCYTYYAGKPIAQGGCKTPMGYPDSACMSYTCKGEGIGNCTSSGPPTYADCGSPSCWQDPEAVNGVGTICANNCSSLDCAGNPRKICRTIQKPGCVTVISNGCAMCSCEQ